MSGLSSCREEDAARAGPDEASGSVDAAGADGSAPFEADRRRMIELLGADGYGIRDARVLAAMAELPRHAFVPDRWRSQAYADRPLPIGHGQTISQPFIVALMTELLAPEPGEKVLEIGTGSGYQAAVLAKLVDHVFTIEIVEPLARQAEGTLKELGIDNVTVRYGDGYRGWAEEAPFDAVIVTCAPDDVPQPLIDQLREGGRMIIPVGDSEQELHLLEKKDGRIIRRSVLPVRFVPMTGEARSRSR